MNVFDALEQEYDALEAMLVALHDADWERPSMCPGWTVTDVVLHLAQSEEGVVATLTGAPPPWSRPMPAHVATTDDFVEQWVSSERGLPVADILDRWTNAHTTSLAAFRSAGPDDRFAWVTNALKARTLATTRLSEHWIHANDIAQPLGIDYPDTHRLWHIARLAHRTIPYAFARAGRDDPPATRFELAGPAGDEWTFGDGGAECVVRGSASELCRIAARRLAPGDAPSIVARGPRAPDVLDLLRTYA